MNLLCGLCGQVHTEQYEHLKCIAEHGGQKTFSARQVSRRGPYLAEIETNLLADYVHKVFDARPTARVIPTK